MRKAFQGQCYCSCSRATTLAELEADLDSFDTAENLCVWDDFVALPLPVRAASVNSG